MSPPDGALVMQPSTEMSPNSRPIIDTNADIARHLVMKESTVKAHVSRILTALEVTNRVQAALLARDAGLAP